MATPTADTLVATGGRLRAGRARLADWDRTPTPRPTVYYTPVNARRLLFLNWWFDFGDRYLRFLNNVILPTTGTVTWGVNRRDLNAGGALVAIKTGGAHTLVVDGVDRPEFTWTVASAHRGSFSVDLASLAPGWRLFQVREPDGALSLPMFAHVGVDRVDDRAPLTWSTHDVAKAWEQNAFDYGNGIEADVQVPWCWIPATATPRRFPIPEIRLGTDFATMPGNTRWKFVDIMPRWVKHRLRVLPTAPGKLILTTFGTQSYFYGQLVDKYPTVDLIDGPRGVAAFSFGMDLHIGRGTQTTDPASPRMGTVYMVTPWSLVRFKKDGSATTLVGWRSKTDPATGLPYCTWPSSTGTGPGIGLADRVELVGNWSALTAAGEPVGFHEAWQQLVDSRTTRADPSKAPTEGGDQAGRNPHFTGLGARWFITDTANDRILRIQFDADSHAVPAVVTICRKFATGSRPWGLVETTPGRAVVSLDALQRLEEIDLDTGATIRVIAQGASTVPWQDISTDFAAMRLHRVVRPNGLRMLRHEDGTPERLYVGDFYRHDIQSMDWATETWRPEADLSSVATNKSNFVHFDISDGKTGPRGCMYVVTWSEKNGGLPYFYPGNGAARTSPMVDSGGYPYGYSRGGYFGRHWYGQGFSMYAQGVACYDGQIVFTGMDYGMTSATVRDAGDTAAMDTPTIVRNKRAWLKLRAPGYYMTEGVSPFGIELPPLGEDVDLDGFLADQLVTRS